MSAKTLRATAIACFIGCLAILTRGECHAWRTFLNGRFNSSIDRATAVALYPDGDAVIAGIVQDEAEVVQRIAAIRVDAETGNEVWRATVPGAFATQTSLSNLAQTVAIDSSGDVLLGGQVEDSDSVRSFAVIKLNGATGEVIWRYVLPGKGSARALVPSPSGDIVAVGTRFTEASESLVIILLSTQGSERWRTEVAGDPPSLALSVGLDEFGSIVCGGSIGGLFAVLKVEPEAGGVLWQAAGPFPGRVRAITFDENGDVVAAGNDVGMGMVVSKLSTFDGHELWRQYVAGGPDGEAASVAVDGEDDIVVGGTVQDGEGGRLRGVVKLAGESGMELWRADPPFSFDVTASAITTGGNVVAAGVRGRESIGESNDFAVAEFSGVTGSIVWHQVVPGTANDVDAATALRIDDRTVVSVGFTRGECEAPDIFAIKSRLGSGAELWRTRLTGSLNISHDNNRAIALKDSGDVVVLGSTQNSPTCEDIAAARLDGANGRELWRTEFTGSAAESTDRGRGLALRGAGDVFLTGFTDNALTSADILVVRLDASTGDVRWRREVNGRLNGNDGGLAITLDVDGHPVVAGTLTENDMAGDLVVIKFDAESGGELWRYVLGGAANGFDQGTAIDLSPSGLLAVAGTVENLVTGHDFEVVALDPTDGAELWRTSIEGPRAGGEDAGVALRVDSEGDVVAGGYVGGRPSSSGPVDTNLGVVKLAAADGIERWRMIVNGTAAGSTDALTALAIDATGAPLVAGALENETGSLSNIVLKLAANTGAEQWRYDGGGVSTQIVALATFGNDLLATGFARKVDGPEFVVLRLDGGSGDETWKRTIRGSLFASEPSRNDAGTAIIGGADGNVVVAGTTRNGAGGEDITVAKLRGVDGRDFVAQVCAGDCDNDQSVKRAEQLEAVTVALGILTLDACVAADPSGDAAVTVDELVAGTRSAAGACQLQ